MSKDKKKKKKDGSSAKAKGGTKTLRKLTENPMIADIVVAALVGMASALKDSKKARQLAADAGDEIAKLAKGGTERGNAMWDLALQVGRRSLETLASEAPRRAKSKPRPKKNPPKRQAKASGSS
jgi:hypothetical protein